jgi:drug/metabolite transporter (DMT)-like permease
MKHVGAAKANFFRYFVPAAAAVAGALFFNESIWITQIVGGLVIILGLVWIGTERKQQIPPIMKISKSNR